MWCINNKMSNTYVSRLMAVEPLHFDLNEETLEDNHFCDLCDTLKEDCQVYRAKAHKEWQMFMKTLQEDYGVEVRIFQNSLDNAPDEVFPDWCTTLRDESFSDGVLIVYPMRFPSRRRERDPNIIDRLKEMYSDVIDLTYFEEQDKFLEGKGTLTWDKKGKNIIMAESPRAHPDVARELVRRLNERTTEPWRLHVFHAYDEKDQVIYHTDLVLNISPTQAFFCKEAVRELAEQEQVLSILRENNYNVIEVTLPQVHTMTCNFQYIYSPIKKEHVYIFSKQAEKWNLPLDGPVEYIDVKTLEHIGGGSIHCMLVELW